MKLLSHFQQELLVHIFSTMGKGMKTKDIKERDIYKNNLSMYSAIKYLKLNNVVYQKKDSRGNNIYHLTLKGEILARILSTFESVPEDIRKKAFVLY